MFRQCQHAPIFAHHLSYDALDAPRTGVGENVTQQQFAMPAALATGGDSESKLRLIEVRVRRKPAYAQEGAAIEQEKGHLAVVVDLGQTHGHLMAEVAERAEKAEPPVPRREGLDECSEQRLVVRTNGPEDEPLAAMFDDFVRGKRTKGRT